LPSFFAGKRPNWALFPAKIRGWAEFVANTEENPRRNALLRDLLTVPRPIVSKIGTSLALGNLIPMDHSQQFRFALIN